MSLYYGSENSATIEDIAGLKEYLKSNDYDFTTDSELSKFPDFDIKHDARQLIILNTPINVLTLTN